MSTDPGRLRVQWSSVAGFRLFYRAGGESSDGVPIVCVHGIGISGTYLLPLAAVLAANHPVVVPDLPGWGRSDQPERALTIGELADVLAEWLTQIGFARAVLLGNSFGCQIIVEFGRRHPERLERAVLAGPTGDPRIRSPLTLLWRLAVDATREPPAEVRIALRDYRRFGFRRGLATARMMIADRFEPKLFRLTAPVLVVRGGRDPIVSARWAERVAALLPDGRLATLPGSPHAVNFDAPNALATLTEQFLAETAAEERR